jgi:hypothetical protein
VHYRFSCSSSSRLLPGDGGGTNTSVTGLRATPRGPDKHNAQNEADETEDDPPRQIRSGRRQQPATPDDTADSRSIHDFSDFPRDRVAHDDAPTRVAQQEPRMN